jgi:AraC-like DNA-binding protein
MQPLTTQERFSHQTVQKYYKHIVSLLVIFALGLFIPFSIISFWFSGKKISGSINLYNNTVLSQIKYNYDYFNSVINNICMEIYLNSNTLLFLYGENFDYYEYISYMRNIMNTTLIINSSIDSIVLYNKNRNEWYSTKSTSPSAEQELSDFISSQESIPRLKPMLRRVTQKQGNLEIPAYVFSYFMYQFLDPAEGSDSYIVVNGDAGWFIDNIAMIQQNKAYTNSIYMVDESGIIYRSTSVISEEIEQALIKDFLQKRRYTSESGSQYYQKEHWGEKYLVSSMQMGLQQNYLIIIQKYNEVFRDLIILQRDFVIFNGIFLFFIVLMLFPVSRKIYLPVRSFMNFILKSDISTEPALPIKDEFEYLRNIYRNAEELNKRLFIKSESYEPMAEQLELSRLADNGINYSEFRENLPHHWLAGNPDGALRVLLFRIDRYMSDLYKMEEPGLRLLLNAVTNIIHTLCDENYKYAVFSRNQDTLCVIIRFAGTDAEDTVIDFIKKCHLNIKNRLNITVSASYGSAVNDAARLYETFGQAKEYLQYRFILGPGRTIGFEQCRVNMENTNLHYPYLMDEKLVSAIKEQDVSLALMVLEDIKKALYNLQFVNITISVMVLINKVALALSEMIGSTSLSFDLEVSEFYKKTINAEFMDDIFRELGQYIESALKGRGKPIRENKNVINIAEIIDFIQNNYSNKNLSSQMISDYMGMSNRYIMYRFKEHTGISLSEYIVDIRIRKAAALLQNTNLSVHQVTMQTGIENYTYFYRLFKNAYHCTPKEFIKRFRDTPIHKHPPYG